MIKLQIKFKITDYHISTYWFAIVIFHLFIKLNSIAYPTKEKMSIRVPKDTKLRHAYITTKMNKKLIRR